MRDFLLNEQDVDEIYIAMEYFVFTLIEIFEKREIREEYPGDNNNEENIERDFEQKRKEDF